MPIRLCNGWIAAVVATFPPRSSSRRMALVSSVAGAGSIALMVGPEGGFSEREMRQLADLGARPASLGPTVLRIELAAAAACAAIRAMG